MSTTRQRKTLITGLLVALAALSSFVWIYPQWFSPLTVWIASLGNVSPFVLHTALLLSFLGSTPVVLVFFVAFCICALARKQLKQGVLGFFSVVMTFAVVQFLKYTLLIERPTTALVEAAGYRFPSGHTALPLALVLAYIQLAKPSRIVQVSLYTIVVLIALSRVVLQVHYAVDLVGGALAAFLVYKIALHVGGVRR